MEPWDILECGPRNDTKSLMKEDEEEILLIPNVGLYNRPGSPSNKVERPWKCHICDELNTASDLNKCEICGVPRKSPASVFSTRSDASRSEHQFDWTCSICTFINTKISQECEMCGTRNKALMVPDTSPSTSSEDTPLTSPDKAFIKLALRGGSSLSKFASCLKIVLDKKEWNRSKVFKAKEDQLIVGVSGLLQRSEQTSREKDAQLEAAFADLDSLVHAADSMVKMAQTIALKLGASQGKRAIAGNATLNEARNQTAERKAQDIDESQERVLRSILVQLGIATSSIVTKEDSGSSYYPELAREIAAFCLVLAEQRKGAPIIPLADVYCLYNRARGVDLASPSDIRQAAELFDELSLPVTLRRLKKGLLVVQVRSKDEKTMIEKAFESSDGHSMPFIDVLQLASSNKISISLAHLYLREAEISALVCRDDAPSGPRYYRNQFLRELGSLEPSFEV